MVQYDGANSAGHSQTRHKKLGSLVDVTPASSARAAGGHRFAGCAGRNGSIGITMLTETDLKAHPALVFVALTRCRIFGGGLSTRVSRLL